MHSKLDLESLLAVSSLRDVYRMAAMFQAIPAQSFLEESVQGEILDTKTVSPPARVTH